MSKVSLTDAINESFITRFRGLSAQQGSTSNYIPGGNANSTTNISSGLRTGAKLMWNAIQNLNSVIAVLNISEDSLNKLEEITGEVIDLAKKATEAGSGSQARQKLSMEFQSFGGRFFEIVENAKIEKKDYLTTKGLSEILTAAGLDEASSQSIEDLFSEFQVIDDVGSLAADEIKGRRPVKIPPSAYTTTGGGTVSKQSKEYDSVFDTTRSLRTMPDAYRLLSDVTALHDQIQKNKEAILNAKEIVGKNVDLVRATGLAFLDISETITDEKDAEKVAQDLRDKIRMDAKSALSQAENLDSIIVAALAFESQ